MKSIYTKKAIFFDRDGVLNKEIGDYVTNENDFELLPDAIDCIDLAFNNDYLVIVITNQGGIGKGLYDKNLVYKLHSIIQEKSENKVKEFFFCPHHPISSNCFCRKPDSLMIEKAIGKYLIDKNSSLMIGDTQRDIDAATKSGINSILIQPNQPKIHLLQQWILSKI